jgi:signal transduction histidine kinase/DNA-binding LacI/PurR family transcriptional regulator/DNA-binding NarL/FixJ family response regulator
MQPPPFAIGILTSTTGGYYFGAMLNGIHQVTRAAGVPLLVTQSKLDALRLPAFGAEYVAGWILLHPEEQGTANLTALVASGVPVLTVPTALDDVVCSSLVADNFGDTRALVNHLINHGHRRIGYIDHGDYTWGRERYQGYLEALRERGIALDSSLVIDTTHIQLEAEETGPLWLVRRGEIAARALITRGMPCTALVAGTDLSALGAIQVFQDAGHRVPEDVAVVGFDDIAEAQYAQPPLTTVRTRFDQLGRMAAEEMLAVLRGERDAQPRRIVVPSRVLCRRSCGCAGPTEIQLRGTDAVAAASDWQGAMAQQLVALVAYPLALDPGTPPSQIWPGVGTLIAAVDAVLQGQESATFVAGIEAAWQQAVAISENQELLDAALTLLEEAAEQRLALAPVAARPAIPALFRQMRRAMMRARLGYEAAKNQYLMTVGLRNQNISLNLLSSQVGESQPVAWLRETPASWGCLGLWDMARAGFPATLAVAGVYQPDRVPAIAIGDRYNAATFPPLAALPLPARQGHDLTILCPLCAGTDDLGVLALCGFADHNFSFDTESLWTQAALLVAALKRDALVTRLEAQSKVLAHARDAAEAANAAKSAFLANMSHELRTPLNTILGFARLMGQQNTLPHKAQDDLDIILRSGEHLLTLINQVLDLAKIEAGRATRNDTNFDLDHLLGDLDDMFGFLAKDKGLELIVECSPEVPHAIRADQVKLHQVLINLLSNALKFTNRGQVMLRVHLADQRPTTNDQRPISDDDPAFVRRRSSFVVFEVEDTGPGIAPEELAQLGGAFVQASAGQQAREGTGLGLTISRSFVQLMGGELRIESSLGQGTTVSFDIPLREVDAGTLAAPTDRARRQVIALAPGQPRYRMLVADDHWAARQLLIRLLTPLGMDVREASNGQEAAAIWQEWAPHLIWMDLRMPIMNGLSATRRIKATACGQATIIIAVTASSFEEERAAILAAGCDDFLRKPFHEADIFALLEKHLGVRLVYADQPSAASASVPISGMASTPTAPAPVPNKLLTALEKAVTELDPDAIQQAIDAIRPYDSGLAQVLAGLAQNFQYRQILRTIHSVQAQSAQEARV